MITVFGSINLDQVYQVTRLPKAGETLSGNAYMQVPGGKGANQALAARRSGAEVTMLGCVGRDANADLALSLLTKDGVDLTYLQISEGPTGCASVWVGADGENSIVVFAGANAELNATKVPKEVIEKSDFLLLQMEVPSAENSQILKIAKKCGVTTLLNLAPVAPVSEDMLHDLNYLVLNEIEASFLAKQLGQQAIDMDQLLAYFSDTYDLCCVITLGGDGVKAQNAGERFYVPADTVEVVDTTAAGDSFIGGFCAALERGEALQDALKSATAIAGLSCTRAGAQTSIPYLRESY
ncbi:ribokinase [Sneathiella glossodoripedis]|uniref:ribokinase n=1 Tax=Sneathiella glossodoripedis TaxID=418853 RepID=UPI00047025E5|nr:ribokinase [Sneathiella glossodoripedis]